MRSTWAFDTSFQGIVMVCKTVLAASKDINRMVKITIMIFELDIFKDDITKKENRSKLSTGFWIVHFLTCTCMEPFYKIYEQFDSSSAYFILSFRQTLFIRIKSECFMLFQVTTGYSALSTWIDNRTRKNRVFDFWIEFLISVSQVKSIYSSPNLKIPFTPRQRKMQN